MKIKRLIKRKICLSLAFCFMLSSLPIMPAFADEITPAPTVSVDDVTNKIVDANATMEYSTDDGNTWTAYDTVNEPTFTGAMTVLIRVAAHDNEPAGAIATFAFTEDPVKPAPPTVTVDDITNKIIGSNETMEFSLDNGTTWIANNILANQTFADAWIILVRIAAQGINPASDAVTLTFTPDPVKPAPPVVTIDDIKNKIVGINTTMEYTVNNGATWTKYNPQNEPTFSGAQIVLVRLTANGNIPAGYATSLTFTVELPKPAAPSVSVDDVKNKIVGATAAMEYSVDGGTSWISYNTQNEPIFVGSKIVLVRLSATSSKQAGYVTCLSFTMDPPKPSTPSVTADDIRNKIVGANATMEYFIVGGTNWIPYNVQNEPIFEGSKIVLIRVSAKGVVPEGEEKILVFTADKPKAPSLTVDDVSNKIIGINSTMEYSIVGSTTWVSYNARNEPIFEGTTSVLVRVAAKDAVPAGESTTLTFTTNPQKPSAPSVTADDISNIIIGGNATMEYSVDGGTVWIPYNTQSIPIFEGTKNVLVRVAAKDATPAGESKTLTFTVNPQKPKAPSVTADDTANKIIGANATMEYSVDGGTTWLVYNIKSEPVFEGAKSVLVRVTAKGSVPSGEATTLTFSNESPASYKIYFRGQAKVGNTITASYTINDKEPGPQNNAVIKWYRSNDIAGTDKALIKEATTGSYKITGEDQGKYLIFEITPLTASGTPMEKVSSYIKVIGNSKPVIRNLKLIGTVKVGQKLTVSYEYFDLESDAQGYTEIKWYRADDKSGINRKLISNAKGLSYVLTKEDQNKYIYVVVTPKAKTGTLVGSKKYISSDIVPKLK